MTDRIFKLYCKQCGMFCGFIRNNVPPLPNSCPLRKLDKDQRIINCNMQKWLESQAPRPPIQYEISRGKSAVLTPRQAAKLNSR